MTPDPRRILIADDLPSIHEDYRKILAPAVFSRPPLPAFADYSPPRSTRADAAPDFELACVLQGESAVSSVVAARAAGRPYSVAFVDVRMPPGIDGVETARRIREADPEVQLVLCTAYSDYSLDEIARRLPESDGLLILKKPFDPVEVQQLARSLSRKWLLAAEHRALRAELEARVASRTGELVQAKSDLELALRAAEAASRAKSEFLANMSHEIRTPLNAVLGMAELLQATPMTPAQREFTDTIRTSSDALLGIINEILDFSRLEHGQMELEQAPFDLRRTMREAVEIAAPPQTRHGLALRQDVSSELPELVSGDALRVRQILVNLVSNAVKFTERGEVVVAASPSRSGGVRLSVRDTGIGIPRERQDRLFQAFSQVDASTTRRYGGTGLGLAITHRLVGLLGGSIRLSSDVGVGSEFVVELPLPPASSVARPAPRPAASGSPKAEPNTPVLDASFSAAFPLRILLVEDNAVNQRVASLLLRKLGYEPVFSNNGAEALEALAKQSFDVVLLDVQMPVMDGLECARRLRADYADTVRPWIVAMTANALEGDREICLSAGMDDYTSKPVRTPVIAEALRRAHRELAVLRGKTSA